MAEENQSQRNDETPVEKIHPTTLRTNVPDQDLGRQLMALRYDLLQDVLVGMWREARRQASADEERGRNHLAAGLDRFAMAIDMAMEVMGEEILPICEPYIEAEKNEQKRDPRKT